jgi:hypothetical protein
MPSLALTRASTVTLFSDISFSSSTAQRRSLKVARSDAQRAIRLVVPGGILSEKITIG